MRLDLERETATRFPEVAEAEKIETARIWFCKYRTLEPLGAFVRLRALTIAGYPTVPWNGSRVCRG